MPLNNSIIDVIPTFKIGDPCPEGYGARIEWNNVHARAGLKQERCGMCMLWKWPHEMNSKIHVSYASRTKRGPTNVRMESRYCLECDPKEHAKDARSATNRRSTNPRAR